MSPSWAGCPRQTAHPEFLKMLACDFLLKFLLESVDFEPFLAQTNQVEDTRAGWRPFTCPTTGRLWWCGEEDAQWFFASTGVSHRLGEGYGNPQCTCTLHLLIFWGHLLAGLARGKSRVRDRCFKHGDCGTTTCGRLQGAPGYDRPPFSRTFEPKVTFLSYPRA